MHRRALLASVALTRSAVSQTAIAFPRGAASASVTPPTVAGTVYQHVGGGGNPYTRGQSGNAYKLPMPNSSGAGNAIILAFTNDAGATISSISDNINGSWPAASVTASGGAGNLDSRIYVLPNIAAGVTTITVTFGSSVRVFQYCMTELHGIATSSPTNGTASNAYSTTKATGSFTPGNNNANGGNFIWSYFAKADTVPSDQTTAITAGSSFTLLNADVGWANANDSMTKAVQAYVQGTSAAINPSITSASDNGDQWNSLAVALKISSGAGTAPAAGIRLNGIQHFSTVHFPTSGTYSLQACATGNLRVLQCPDPNLHALAITDGDGNTYTPDGQGAGFWYAKNTSANSALTISIVGGGSDNVLSWRFIDISGAAASPFDSAVASNQNVSSVTSFTASPSPSPSNTNGLVIAGLGLGNGPGLGVTAPGAAIWDYCIYTGEVDLDLIENADILAHYHNTASGSETWTFTITSIGSNSTTGGFICFHA